ncbi:MAG: hypothetical protein WA708_05995, partial [Acidobacteriaceae bacterium]
MAQVIEFYPLESFTPTVRCIDTGVALDLRNELQGRAESPLIEAERMSAIGRMACSISHDMR